MIDRQPEGQPLYDLENLDYAEELYVRWLRDPSAVDSLWRELFGSLDGKLLLPAGQPRDEQPVRRGAVVSKPAVPADGRTHLQSRVDSLLWAFRDVGYFYARLNPLVPGHEPSQNYLYPRAKGAYEQLSVEAFGLSEADLEEEFSAGRAMEPSRAPLREILAAFRETYCGSFGVEFLHIQNKPIRNWLLHAMESSRNKPQLADDQRVEILEDLIRAEEFEQFLHKTFIGQKRFSLEGAEVLIPALHFLINEASRSGVEEIVLGTTHRGRITILNQILEMPVAEIFTLFEDSHSPGQYGGSGDVKYHLGFSTDHAHADGSAVHLTLTSNPSHLESVDGVVEGKTRGEQCRPARGSFIQATKKVVPVILHGDSAFSGQGVVAEIFNLSQLRGYHTGGTIHIVINNQIGFTTSSRDARSTFFPTDVAKMTSVPVFHVNGDDPETLVHAMALALSFRRKMSQDVVVDIVCYRRHGHNEGDEPSFTNPRMYEIIRSHPSVAEQYGRACAERGLVSAERQIEMRKRYAGSLREALKKARENPPEPTLKAFQGEEWNNQQAGYSQIPVETGVPEEILRDTAGTLTTVPAGFAAHPKLVRILQEKRQRLEESGRVDWALAESLAFGSLLLEGTPVRLSGQDCERGTFSQRHAAWWDTSSHEAVPYMPLNHLAQRQARFYAYDSPLSEYSVLAFEYGYSLASPYTLVLWEAQFGDFSNGAQVIIDNFIAAALSKWQRSSGLVMLLPHGYEGQGPEHSSAHLERFLQLCAEDNIEVCNLTTPAQYFHLLRRQMRRDFRRPLVLMSPKSLLRHPRTLSPLSDLSTGGFEPLLEEARVSGSAPARRLILCTGKIYYDLLEKREELGGGDTALVRVEQLYPFPLEGMKGLLARFGENAELLWVQEEPENRGALRYLRNVLGQQFPERRFWFVSRPASASPAVGSHRLHQQEQEEVLARAFAPRGSPEPGRRGKPSGGRTQKGKQ